MKPVESLRKIGNAEGLSYLLLLGVAMPLKYMANMPEAVRILGSVHGFLFVAFMIALGRVWLQVKWPYDKIAMAFLLSIIPFGTFYLDKKLKEEYPNS